MSDLTFLVAISFLGVATVYVTVLLEQTASDLSAEIVTGVVRGIPVSLGVREGLLWGMWLPTQVGVAVLAAFVGLAALEMADHVSAASVKLLAQMFAFLVATGGGLALMSASFGFFRYRAKLRRVKQHQAKAD